MIKKFTFSAFLSLLLVYAAPTVTFAKAASEKNFAKIRKPANSQTTNCQLALPGLHYGEIDFLSSRFDDDSKQFHLISEVYGKLGSLEEICEMPAGDKKTITLSSKDNELQVVLKPLTKLVSIGTWDSRAEMSEREKNCSPAFLLENSVRKIQVKYVRKGKKVDTRTIDLFVSTSSGFHGYLGTPGCEEAK